MNNLTYHPLFPDLKLQGRRISQRDAYFRTVTLTDMAAAGAHNSLQCVGTLYPTTACFQHFLLRKKAVPRFTPLPHFAPRSPTLKHGNQYKQTCLLQTSNNKPGYLSHQGDCLLAALWGRLEFWQRQGLMSSLIRTNNCARAYI